MNWFTNSYVSSRLSEDEIKKKVSELDGCCEHVQENNSLLHCIHAENDSFGSETYGLCKECHELNEKEEGEEEVVCYDCKGTFKKKDTIEWKWYDFYYKSGDKSLIVCNSCKDKEKHKQRVLVDNENYQREFGDDEMY